MKAMVFAAGLGTRLKPFTLNHPKALVPVGGVSMLQRVLLKIKGLGISDVVVNVHHFSQQIIDFLAENSNFGLNISISDESAQLLDTGGGILAAEPYLRGDEPILVHNADILTDFDIPEMIEDFEKRRPLASLLVSERSTSRYFLFNQAMQMRGWVNVSTGETRPAGVDTVGCEKFAFGGVHIVSPQIFPLLRAYAAEHGAVFSITPFYIGACDKNPIIGHVPLSPFAWHDIGKPESLAAANESLR